MTYFDNKDSFKHQVLKKSPSNIALIKYMGKLPGTKNLPANPSLSYTLKNLTTSVAVNKNITITKSAAKITDKDTSTFNLCQDQWKPLDSKLKLTKKSQERFLKHWSYLKKYFNIKGSYTILSSNNFPASCGLASSASSFSALTKAAYQISLDNGKSKLKLVDLANLSRAGSGSSCRSLFLNWAEWDGSDVKDLPVHKDYINLNHNVLLVSTNTKKVSSSEAHSRVLEHSDFNNRVKRSKQRFVKLKNLLTKPNQFLAIKDLVWNEFIDMHQLFETCPKPFSYFTPVVKDILKDLSYFITEQKINLLVTMDAGPNIHLLYPKKEEDKIKIYLYKLTKKYKLTDLGTFNKNTNV
ncbi:MAG: diphosphomevalonate decarboxylase [Bdellovibrionales bacterium]|nr:diphosphomevalonate decarboxylase [Bdellovibrionales bacterium]